MTFPDIIALLRQQTGFTLDTNEQNPQPYVWVSAEQLPVVASLLRNHEQLYFDRLACLTALDNGPEAATMEVAYNFDSIPYGHTLLLKVQLPRPADGSLPSVPSLAHLWRTADWHEREAYDLMGIRFENHPDLRRILLPADWEGHPLRKDYREPETYHGIRTESPSQPPET